MPFKLLDKIASATNRDTGMKSAIDHAESVVPSWKVRALKYLKDYPLAEFMAEEVRVWAYENGLPLPTHGRAWGAVIREAKQTGLIKHIGYGNVKNPKAHRTPASIWEKQL